ncbi:hypothetical protein RHMOL_Rhmol10G0242400 [Rhododendron molle]|uniref:Uncharacterized protein n=1 Tax=Rhododendron molle TaxID=49168 RepID=A0ACC0M5N3_RHOML|nr:hypothetical protein RHMOL_Rhmol10G0242400 [Rhododendron molle]
MSNVTIESDSSVAVGFCNEGPPVDHPHRHIVEEARRIAARTNSFVVHIYRQANQTANCLARLGSQQNQDLVEWVLASASPEAFIIPSLEDLATPSLLLSDDRLLRPVTLMIQISFTLAIYSDESDLVYSGVAVWDIRLRRDVNEWEEEALKELLSRVYGLQRLGREEDEIRWNLSKDDSFRVKSYFESFFGWGTSFPWKAIWKTKAPLKRCGVCCSSSHSLPGSLGALDYGTFSVCYAMSHVEECVGTLNRLERCKSWKEAEAEQQSQSPSDQGMVRRLRRVVEALVLFKYAENEAAQKSVLSIGFCAHRGDDLSGANAVMFCCPRKSHAQFEVCA